MDDRRQERGRVVAGEIQVTVVGNLTADPELRFIPSGQAVAGFTVAQTPRKFNRETNAWEDGDTVFMRCTVWRDYAEHVAESLHRGDRVIAIGRLRQRTYEVPADGSSRTVVEMDVDDIGPILRFVTATIHRADRTPQQQDPWATTPPAQQQPQQAPQAPQQPQPGPPGAQPPAQQQPQWGGNEWGNPAGYGEPPF